MGEALTDAKNQLLGADEDNARRFTLLGDPSQTLAFPEYRVATTTINGKAYNKAQPDTISALEQVSLDGEVRDTLGAVKSDFNGRVFVTVYDKPQKLQTLGQDPTSYPLQFEVQRSIIFRGSASVTSGRFSVSFITPKDINLTPGFGKISYYAENGTPLDAAGNDNGIIIAGISNTIKDDQPPVVQVFMNDDKFATGGITDANPRIYAKISDDYGINVTGTSIGHDLTGVVDLNVQETIVLNDFYQSNLNNSKAGTATYPLANIKPGLHKVKVEAWDIANNKGVGYTEFFVTTSAAAGLDHVLNYPNPFTTSTQFQFEHNLVGQLLDIQVRIFSVSGKLVKTIQHQSSTTGYRVTDVLWDGKDDFGDQIGKGVYLYKVAVRGTDPAGNSKQIESAFEKLVILK
jgi:FlgD Ig-like domain